MSTHPVTGLNNLDWDQVDGQARSEFSDTTSLDSWLELPCPYCGETSGFSVDQTDPTRVFVEDCQVCCQPIQVTVRVNSKGNVRLESVRRLDD